MPTEIAMSYTSTSLPTTSTGGGGGGGGEQQPIGTETKSGAITLVAPNGRRQGVNVIVYRTTLEHFAVLYPQKKICRPLGVVNIKTTKVERLLGGFAVRQLGFDTPMTLTFLCDARDLDGWLEAFAPAKRACSLRHQRSLPCVEEDEEI